jgi:hypothetical protein
MEKNITNRPKQIAVIYHFPCHDGSYSALNLYLYITNFYKHKYKLHFHPSNSNNRISDVLSVDNKQGYDKIYIFDKGLGEEDFVFLLSLKDDVRINVIDHHSSSVELFNKNFRDKFEGKKNIKIMFEENNTRSASGMTYDKFVKKAQKRFKDGIVLSVFTKNWKRVRIFLIFSLLTILRTMISEG